VKRKHPKEEDLKRVNRQSLMFNNREMQAIEKYCKKYKVDNKSKMYREAIISSILRTFNDDYPTLWDQPGLFADSRVKPLVSYKIGNTRF
jgi:hypothetical protein